MTDSRYQLLRAGKTCVANVNRKDDQELIAWAESQDLFLYIGRWNSKRNFQKSKWHNPFKGTRHEVIKQFEEYLINNASLMSAIPELKGKLLGCWCYPEECHGDILARLANG